MTPAGAGRGSDGPVLALTQGDPAGIGPEIALKCWDLCRRHADGPRFFVLSDPRFMAREAERLHLPVPILKAEPETAAASFADGLPVVPLGAEIQVGPGRAGPAMAAATLRSISDGVALVQAGRAAAIVTNPINKHALHEAGFLHPGHTEYLADLAARPGVRPPQPVMMLWSEDLAVVPVTIHVPLAAVPGQLSIELIVSTGRIVASDLRTWFGIARPRLAVAGLNPHASESGSIGREDLDVVAPAVAALRDLGIEATGPWPADSLFHAEARPSYDVALAMYHDQALIPIKTIAFDDAVNVTLGLPFLRTSPDHGTAYDIAGRGIARPDSLLAALKLAHRLTAPR